MPYLSRSILPAAAFVGFAAIAGNGGCSLNSRGEAVQQVDASGLGGASPSDAASGSGGVSGQAGQGGGQSGHAGQGGAAGTGGDDAAAGAGGVSGAGGMSGTGGCAGDCTPDETRPCGTCGTQKCKQDCTWDACISAGIICYRDADEDGYGDPAVIDSSECAGCATGYVLDNTDCNDDASYGAKYHPGQTSCFEADSGGGWDYNCNGSTDPSAEGCTACGVVSVNPRWCDGSCGTQVFKLTSLYSGCGQAGSLTLKDQICGDEVNCGGTYPLTNNVGKGACIQGCK